MKQSESVVIIHALLLGYFHSVIMTFSRDPKRSTAVDGCLICFTWLQKGLLKPPLKNSLRVHPRAGIYRHNNSFKQHHALTVRPPAADAPPVKREARPWWEGLNRDKVTLKCSLLNCFRVIQLTAAMVAASHSSFTNTVRTEAELAQTEHES